MRPVNRIASLRGVLAHELAHDDLAHVAKAQALGAGLGIGMIILDQIFPASGAGYSKTVMITIR